MSSYHTVPTIGQPSPQKTREVRIVIPSQFAGASRVLAANQGLYNGFLAAGLFWGLSLGAAGTGIKVFFLCCVLVAGLYPSLTLLRHIFG